MALTILPGIAIHLLAAEAAPAPLSERAFAAVLEAEIPDGHELDPGERKGCFAEIVGLRFGTAHGPDRQPWGIYFVPIMSGQREDGSAFFAPNALEADAEIVEYWAFRSECCAHPTLRSRYADLAREIGGLFNKQKDGQPRIELPLALAHRAIDAYLDVVGRSLAADEDQAWRFLDRAMEISLQIKDGARIGHAKSAAWVFHRKTRAGGAMRRWWMIDNLFWDRKGLIVEAGERAELIAWLEQALARCANMDDKAAFDPHQAADAAERIRRWHGAADRDKGMLAIKTAGAAFEAVAAIAEPTLAAAWLEDLSARYRAFNLDADAARVDLAIMARSDEPVSGAVGLAIPRLDLEDEELLFDALAASSAEDALARIATHMLAPPDQVRQLVERDAAASPLGAMLDIKIAGPSGFTSATVGSAADDMPGRVVFMAARIIEGRSAELHGALQRAKGRWGIGVDDIMAFVTRSPAFPAKSHPMVRTGLDAWFAGDALKAIHVLVPQVEAALRAMLIARGESPMRPREGGAFESMGMGAVLATQAFKAGVAPALRLHLRALYADAKGINLRNHLAHGLAGREMLGAGLANWVVHSLLAIAVLEGARA